MNVWCPKLVRTIIADKRDRDAYRAKYGLTRKRLGPYGKAKIAMCSVFAFAIVSGSCWWGFSGGTTDPYSQLSVKPSVASPSVNYGNEEEGFILASFCAIGDMLTSIYDFIRGPERPPSVHDELENLRNPEPK